MVITAVGKYHEKELTAKVKDLFGSLDKKKLPAKELHQTTNRKRKTAEERKDISQVYMCLGYKVPGSSKDTYVLEMLSSLSQKACRQRSVPGTAG